MASLTAFATSRLGLRAFCAERGVPRATFTFWQRQARARAPQKSRARRDRPTFARVELVPPSAPRGITVVVRDPAGLEAELTGLDVTTLVTVLRLVLRPEER